LVLVLVLVLVLLFEVTPLWGLFSPFLPLWLFVWFFGSFFFLPRSSFRPAASQKKQQNKTKQNKTKQNKTKPKINK
jgi:hypothetical protein